jgi:uncharacterized membrane protein YqjE
MLTQHTTPDTRSFGQLFKDLKDDAAHLIRDEVALARTELSQSISRGLRDVTILMIGVCIGLLALQAFVLAIIAALVVALSARTDPDVALWLAPLIVAVGLAIAAVSCIWVGRQRLSRRSITPHTTTETLRETQQWLRNRMT